PSCINSSLRAAQSPERASLEREQQEEEIEPESGQEVPVWCEQAQAVAAGCVGHAPDPRQHDCEPDQAAEQMHAVQPGEDVEERAVRVRREVDALGGKDSPGPQLAGQEEEP